MTRLLPGAAFLTFAISLTLVTLAGAQAETLGHDYLAYDAAARRLLGGEPLYDTNYETAGGFGLYLYPPPFALAVVPLAALVPPGVAVWLWTGILVALLLGGVALLPVDRTTRWLILGLAGISWPVVYSIKLGQVGPLLFFLFVLGWRWLSSDLAVGAVAGLGSLVKVQPALLVGWALLQRRWRAVAIGVAVTVLAGLVTIPIAGGDAWPDFVNLLVRVSDPLTTPGNATIGAIAVRAGLDSATAAYAQWLTTGVAVLMWLFACLRRGPVVGYLATVVASQLISPILWDHYAMLLLVPVAWLLHRRGWWATLLLLAAPWPLASLVPPVVYPAALLTALVAVARRPSDGVLEAAGAGSWR